MSTKKETKSENIYDPQSMSQYHQNHGGATNVLAEYMKDPLKSSYYQLHVGILDRLARNMGQRGIQNVLAGQNWAGGVRPGYLTSMLNRSGRQTGAMQAQGVVQALMEAEQNRRWAAGAGMADRPLQTGQNTTETTSGLGTWLPQVIGAGVSGLAAFATGGASMAAKAGMGAAKAGSSLASGFAGANPGGNFNPSYFGFNDYQSPMSQFQFGK